jgi:hypothetical protein
VGALPRAHAYVAGSGVGQTLLPPESTFNYFQFVTLQAGADLKATQSFGIGPFASFAIGKYNAWSTSIGQVDSSGDMTSGLHEWLTVGVRGQFDL